MPQSPKSGLSKLKHAAACEGGQSNWPEVASNPGYGSREAEDRLVGFIWLATGLAFQGPDDNTAEPGSVDHQLAPGSCGYLRELVDGGYFDASLAICEEGAWAPLTARLDQFLHFLGNAVVGRAGDSAFATLEASDEFLGVFGVAVDRIVATTAGVVERQGWSALPGHKATLAKLMAGACALNLEREIRALARLSPDLMETTFNPSDYSLKLWSPGGRKAIGAHVTPYFAAVQFSAVRSIATLRALGLPGDASLAIEQTPTARRLDAISVWLRFYPFASNEVLLDAIAARNAAPVDAHGIKRRAADDRELCRSLCKGMSPLEAQWKRYRMPSLLVAGAYDPDPAAAVMAACEYGWVAVIRHFQNAIPWRELGGRKGVSTGDVFGMLSAFALASKAMPEGMVEDAALSLIDAAARDGSDAVFGPYLRAEEVLLPSALILAGFDRVIVRLMAAGFDPHRPIQDGSSALAYAERQDGAGPSRVANVMRSFGMRRNALLLIAKACADEAPILDIDVMTEAQIASLDDESRAVRQPSKSSLERV